jgi:general secretion pathway protein I
VRARTARGFTLVEVLVALVIVAIGMSALLASMSSSADTASYLREKTFAQWIGLNQLAVTRLAAKLPSKGTTNGELDYAGRHWAWQQEVTEQDFPGVLRIDVRVQPIEPGAMPKDGRWMATVVGVVGNAVAPPQLASLYTEFGAPGSGAPGGSVTPAPTLGPGTPPTSGGLSPSPAPGAAPPPSTSPTPVTGAPGSQ